MREKNPEDKKEIRDLSPVIRTNFGSSEKLTEFLICRIRLI